MVTSAAFAEMPVSMSILIVWLNTGGTLKGAYRWCTGGPERVFVLRARILGLVRSGGGGGAQFGRDVGCAPRRYS